MAKILLIDSDPETLHTLEEGLTLYGHNVIATTQGDESLSLAINESPDLILMDVDVRGTDSWQTINKLKSSRATWSIPVVAMANRIVTGQMLVQRGFDAYERKPVSLRHILQRIELVLNKTTATRPAKSRRTNRAAMSSGILEQSEDSAQSAVLHISDDSVDSQAMAKIVEGAGYSYASISDPLMALSEMIDIRPELIFLDMVMPLTNGYELCAQIRRIPTFKATPIIIVTNNDRLVDRMRAKIVGASGFLSKPFRVKSVLGLIIKHMSCARRR